jgi:hypothetical protein
LSTSNASPDSTVTGYVWVLPAGITTNASITATSLGNNRYSTTGNSIAINYGSVKTALITVAPSSIGGLGRAISKNFNATPAQPGTITPCFVPAQTDSTFDLTINDVTGVGGSTPYIWKVDTRRLTIVSGQGTTTLRVKRVRANPILDASIVTVSADNDCATSVVRSIDYGTIRVAGDCQAPIVGSQTSTLVAKEDANITSTGSIKLIPNPNKGQFTLTVKSANTVDRASIQIFDAYGRLVSTRFVNNSNGIITTSINDGNLISGTYNVICTIGSEIKTAQMVVQK